MESTSLDIRAFTYIISLAAVINGLGIVRWVTAFSELIRQKSSLEIEHHWDFNLLAGFQFILHILMWWTMWGVRDSANFNFLTYLYLLTGPLLLFLGTSLLIPAVDSGKIDGRSHFSDVRPTYSTVLMLTWLWTILAGPIIRGSLAPTAPLLALFLAAALVLRSTKNPGIHSIVAVVNWLLVATFVALYAMQLGGVAT